MKQNKTLGFWSYIAIAALYFIIGLLCVIIPGPLTTAIPYVLGAALIINGSLRIAGYYLNKKLPAFGLTIYGLAEGILDIVLALIIFINASVSLVIVAVLIGVWALISGIINLTKAINNLEDNHQKIINYIFSATQIILGILLFFNYRGGITVSIVIAGIYLMFLSASIIFTKVVIFGDFSKIKQKVNEAFSPATTRLALEPTAPSVAPQQKKAAPSTTTKKTASASKSETKKPTTKKSTTKK